MASIDVQPQPGSPTAAMGIRSDHPGALAAVPDALVQSLGLGDDVASIWALHPSEQDASRDSAYAHERAELGPHASVDVVEVLRPRQRNVVWIDRYHLVAQTPAPAVVSRLLGLYAGGEGRMMAFVHHPSVSAAFAQLVSQCPHDGGAGWNSPLLVEQARFGVRYDGRDRTSIALLCATTFRPQVQAGLAQLASIVATW